MIHETCMLHWNMHNTHKQKYTLDNKTHAPIHTHTHITRTRTRTAHAQDAHRRVPKTHRGIRRYMVIQHVDKHQRLLILTKVDKTTLYRKRQHLKYSELNSTHTNDVYIQVNLTNLAFLFNTSNFSNILDDFLGVLSLPSTRFSSAIINR